MRHGHNGYLPDRWMRIENILNLFGTQVLAAANNDIFFSAGYGQTTFRGLNSQIPRSEKAVLIEGFAILSVEHIANCKFRPARRNLAFLPAFYLDAVLVNQANLVADDIAIGSRPQFSLGTIRNAECHGGRFSAPVDTKCNAPLKSRNRQRVQSRAAQERLPTENI